jgi:OOP family OmpA-OmpF porin
MRILLLALLALVTAPVYGQAESAYYGVALGSFDYEEGDGFGGELFGDSVSSYRLMVGYQFMEHLTVEGGYGKTGTIRDSATLIFSGPGGGSFPLDFSSEFSILTIRLLGVLPFDNGVSLLGGIGYADLKQDIDFTFAGTPSSTEQTGNEPTYYLGAQYDWDRVAVRLGYEKYDFEGDIEVKETSLTFFYKL